MEEEKVEVEVPEEEEEGEKPVAASGGGGSGSKRKRSPQKVEKGDQPQRTPLKRQRNPVKLFQSPAEQEKPVLKAPKAGTSKEEVQLLYKKGSFLALRGDDGSFFLCRLNQNVTSGKSRKFKLSWLSQTETPNNYKLDYMDKADMDSILTNIRMERVSRDVYELPEEEKERIDKVLNKTLKFVAGDLMDEDLEEEEEEPANDLVEEEEEEEEEEEGEDSSDEPPSKRRRTTPGADSKKKTSTKTNKKTPASKKDKEKEKKRKLKEKGEKKGKGPDRNLRPNPKIKVLEKDPFFEVRDKGPFISVPVQSKQVYSAVSTGNMDMLKELISSENVYRLDMSRSPGVKETPIEYALRKNALDLMDTLITDILDSKVKTPRLDKGAPVMLMQSTGTGRYNPMYLGIGAIRALNVSRGSREGNNAFAKDELCTGHGHEYYMEKALEMGVSPTTLDHLIASLTSAVSSKDYCRRDEVMETCFSNIHLAIENGHRDLASRLVGEAVRVGGYGFNFLHDEVLRFENQDLRDHILGASVRKKPFDNRAITPMHCSAINPNVKYLKRLLDVEPDINLMDRSNRRPIHYAAVCSGTKPLEFLLSKGASITDVDKQGNLPLHRACAAGRAHNVTALLKEAAAKTSESDATIGKWGIGGINRGNRNSYCPIHLAVLKGHMEVLKVLLKNEVNVNRQVSASKNKMTPLMMAAERGCLDMVRLLVQSGASVELLDKLKRSALTHAVINGNTNVASYLLYLGADPNRVDTSGNSLVHYAAAYGWLHCLKLLIKDAGAKYSLDNDWKTTPLAISFLKGHPGIVDYLLSLPDNDINFKDEKGMTLVSIAASSRLQCGLEEQISYLVKEKKADPTIPDLEGYTALHHLCANNIKLKGSEWSPVVCEKAMETSTKVANILLDAGCDISQPTNVGKTPVSLALTQVNFKLVELLVQQGAEIPTEKNDEEKNLLHTLAEKCCTTPMTPLLYILAGQSDPAGSGDQKSTPAAAVSSGEEKMEVDAIADGAGDASNAQPPLPSVAAEPRQSLKNALKKMAADTDFLGFTPLLRACQVYRTYQVPRNPGANRVENDQKWGRNFIQALIEVAGSDVNATVKEKNIPDAKEPTYVKEAKYTACHMMVSCQTEMPVKEGGKEVKHPGLALILRYSPDLELKNLEKDTPLVMAAKDKSADKLILLAEKGANPNVVFNYGCSSQTDKLITPCLWLARGRSLALVRLFLKYGADPKAVVSDTKQTLMHFLVQDRTSEGEVIEMLKTLLDKGLSVNDRDSAGNTALHVAVSCNRGDANDSTLLEEFLLNHKADVFMKNKLGELPLHCTFDNCGQDPIELLSQLTLAMKDQKLDEPCTRGNSPLHRAANVGATICCMHLMQRGAQINRKNSQGNTPLTLAVRNGKDSCAIMLLQQGASVADDIIIYDPKLEPEKPVESKPPPAPAKKEKPVLKWRPLQQQQLQKKEPAEKKRIAHTIFQGAISCELQGVAHLLLDKTGIGFAVIEAALNVNKFNVALRLLKRVSDQRKLQGVNKENQTLLHVLALKTKAGIHEELQLQVAEALLKKEVPVDLVDSQGCTAVQYCAIFHQPVALAKVLIENSKSFDAKSKDKMGRDLVSAVMWDYEWVSNVPSKAMVWLDMLIDKGLSLDTLFDRPLPDVLLFGARLDYPCPDYFTIRGPESVSPLILAIRHYNFGLARYLLKKGASVNFKDSMGYTPLIHAVKMNDITMVKLLLDYDYIHDKEEKASQIMGTATNKPVLMKKYSRNIFLIKTDKRAEENEKDSSVDEDAGEQESENDMEEGIDEVEDDVSGDDDKDQEDVPEDDDEDEDLAMNGVAEEGHEEEEEEEEEEVDDSDHDTDVVEEEEDDEDDDHDAAGPVVEPPPRLGSKQKSLVKVTKAPQIFVKPFVSVTSNIRLNDTDPQGMTAFHHTVFSLDFGSFDNGEVIKLLVAAGGIPNKADMKGEMPKDLALMAGATRIYSALLLTNEITEKLTLTEFTVTDGLLADGSKVDFSSDAETVLSGIDKDGSGESAPAKPKVDSNCEMRSTGEVYQDETKNVTYDVTLTKVDVACGVWGMYNFYKLQIVRQKAKDMYILFTRWGRIGDRGQWQHTPFPTAEDAIKEFCKVFRQKTGNDFNHLDRFVEHKKKYRLMPAQEEPKKNKEVKFDFQSSVVSKLNPAVLDLLQELTSMTMLQAAAKSKGLDEDCMPFGRIMRCSLDKAKDILLELEKLIATVDLQRKNMTTTPMEEYQANCEKLAALTNDFYHLVPVGGYEYEAIRPVRDKKVLKEHFRLISDLMDMEVACKILLGSQRRMTEMNPYDYIYRSMGCKVQPLSENEHETQYILTYINASGHGCKVNAVYKVSRAGEADAMNGLGLHNHRLLWHGTSMANIVSILTRGLLVAPANAPKTGNMFGEGVYFADCFTKSRNYCYNAVGSCKVMLLCQVALGNSLEDLSHDEEDHHDEDVHSLKILGKMAPDPDFDIVLPYGTTIPLGQLKPMTYEGKTPLLQYNEYVIHNPKQICIRYIIMFDG